MLFPEFARLGYDPVAELRRMQSEMNRVFQGLGAAIREFPPVNLWAGDESVVVTAELPGFAPEDVDISVQEEYLTLQGKREPKAEDDDAVWHRRERGYGSFSRTIELPFKVDADQVQGRFANGVLELELKRPESEKPRRIQIRSS